MPQHKLPKQAVRRNARGGVDDAAWELIIEWRDHQGLSHNIIAKRLCISRSTVQYQLKQALPPSQRGKPTPPANAAVIRAKAKRQRLVLTLARKTVTLQGEYISPKRHVVTTRSYTKREHNSPSAMCRVLATKHKIFVSPSTLRRDLKELGLVAKRRRRAPFLTDKHKADRLSFCLSVIDPVTNRLKAEYQDGLLFTDEKRFDSNDHGAAYEWVYPHEEATCRHVEQGPEVVHVWGIIGIGVRKLIILPEGSVTGDVYLKSCLKPSRAVLTAQGKHLVQDNATPHKTRAVTEWLQDANITVYGSNGR